MVSFSSISTEVKDCLNSAILYIDCIYFVGGEGTILEILYLFYAFNIDLGDPLKIEI